jgi:hypothetical protein
MDTQRGIRLRLGGGLIMGIIAYERFAARDAAYAWLCATISVAVLLQGALMWHAAKR